MPSPLPTDPEDAKLVLLARTTRARTRAPEGAAVRDLDGRTYAAASIALTHLNLSALALAVAMAVSSGARGLEAAAVCTDADQVPAADLAVVNDLGGTGVAVWLADASGTPRSTTRT
jgi:hypothetical protein